mmetsp:Transcript_70505/g.199996  ORF Transcript_70505/g.199996 Transcript_70505/m.199996 type:complete len:222 (+) Transcript_70505:516-1181(+)
MFPPLSTLPNSSHWVPNIARRTSEFLRHRTMTVGGNIVRASSKSDVEKASLLKAMMKKVDSILLAMACKMLSLRAMPMEIFGRNQKGTSLICSSWIVRSDTARRAVDDRALDLPAAAAARSRAASEAPGNPCRAPVPASAGPKEAAGARLWFTSARCLAPLMAGGCRAARGVEVKARAARPRKVEASSDRAASSRPGPAPTGLAAPGAMAGNLLGPRQRLP